MNGMDPRPPAMLIPSAVPGLRTTCTETAEDDDGTVLEFMSVIVGDLSGPSNCQQHTTTNHITLDDVPQKK